MHYQFCTILKVRCCNRFVNDTSSVHRCILPYSIYKTRFLPIFSNIYSQWSLNRSLSSIIIPKYLITFTCAYSVPSTHFKKIFPLISFLTLFAMIYFVFSVFIFNLFLLIQYSTYLIGALIPHCFLPLHISMCHQQTYSSYTHPDTHSLHHLYIVYNKYQGP